MPLSQFDYVGFDEQSSRTPSTGKARRAPAWKLRSQKTELEA
jgi:hypothetical protein